MAVLQLTFTNVPANIRLTVEPEDIEHARSIGILTPREVVPTDFVPVVVPKPRVPTWASRAAVVSGQDRHNADHKKLMDDIDFLKIQSSQEADSHEEMLDDLGALWEADLDATIFDPSEPFGHKACRREILPTSATVVVRVIDDKGHFLLGSIAGQPKSVYIPKVISPDMEIETHTFYLMDLRFTPGQRNQWRAVNIHPKLDTGGMIDSVLSIERTPLSAGHPLYDPYSTAPPCADRTTTTFKIPMSPDNIGSMIGRGGHCIEEYIRHAILSGDDNGSWGEPSITILPDGDGCKVIFYEGHSETGSIRGTRIWWNPIDIRYVINRLHC